MGSEDLTIGVDVGSTTVKTVVVHADGSMPWSAYARHGARQAEQVREDLSHVREIFGDASCRIFVTGSGGRALSRLLCATYIQEVNAITYTVERLHPDAGSVVELGGQDAKVIIFKQDRSGHKTTVTFMNDKCAGGTGATLDKILTRIGVSMDRASSIRLENKTVHHIAAKCGVFAETDVVGLLKSGIDSDEIVVSLCVAIVKQNIEVLVRGNVLRDRVLLLGGPHAFIPLFGEIWRQLIPPIWEIQRWKPEGRPIGDLVFVPESSQFFAAIGAVLFGGEAEKLVTIRSRQEGRADVLSHRIEALDEYVDHGRLRLLAESGDSRDGLVRDEAEIEEVRRCYSIPEPESPSFEGVGRLPCWIGLDGGSTSSKLALVDDEGKLVYKGYMLSGGNPIADARDLFGNLLKWSGRQGIELEVLGTAVTGYASSILHAAFSADMNVVETIAHMRAAVFYYGDVDVICDVGGQDIKVMFMRNGRVVDFKLNTQCSAGNGFFLQSMAEQFGIPIDMYAEHAFRARKAPSFSCGCAVFMEQDKVNFQQLGWSKEEIMAGLALVLPLNIWSYVVQEANVLKFGSRFVLQGGTQRNLAAVKAQVDFIRAKHPEAVVHVHRYADMCGAIGAALEAREALRGSGTGFVGIERAAGIDFRMTNDESTRCRFCPNRCPRTFVDIEVAGREPIRFITGNSCERGLAETAEEMKRNEREVKRSSAGSPNLVEMAADLVFRDYDPGPVPEAIARSAGRARGRRGEIVVGIPKILNFYVYAPFFNSYFRALGVRKIVYSDTTSSKLWEEGHNWGAIDPCFPAKVAHAHVYNLLKRGEITHLCVPIVSHLESHLENQLGNRACVIQMGTSEVIEAAFTRDRDFFADSGVEFWKPFVRMDRMGETTDQLLEYFGGRLGLTADENRWAVERGYAAQHAYMEEIRGEGRRLLNWLIENDRIGLVAIAHPYHHDPGLNHGLLAEFQKRGFPIMCIESLPVDREFLAGIGLDGGSGRSPYEIGDIWRRNFNRNTNHKIWASKVVARHPNLAAIDLSSFKCGHDAPTYSYVDNIMDTSGAPHFTFHDIDQNKPHASMKIRIRTFEYFLKLEEAMMRKAMKA